LSVSVDAVSYHARQRAGALACIDLESGRRWSYADLARDVDQTAVWLTDQFGPASGVRVASVARNSVTLLILHLACIRAGAIYAPLNWRLTTPELTVLVRDAQPSLLLHDAEFHPPACEGPCILTADLESRVATASTEVMLQPRPADVASTLLYTSGTSGRPKGVMVTETNAFWSCTNFNLGNGVTAKSTVLCDMPMFHTAGLFASIRSLLLAGGTVLISRGFDPEKTLARIADPGLKVTHYFSVPQMAQMLWQQRHFRPELLQHLTVYATGGAPNPKAQIERFVRAGIRMSDGFGMSETGSNFGMPVHDPEVLLAKAGSCGLPYISVEARIVNDAGEVAATDEVGELWLRGPSVTPGYWNQPQLTEAAFETGWFKTGDAASRDADGYYYLVDRRKDMYISGGENVYPAEVEAVLCELEAVAEAAVIGIPDPRWGEVGRAYIVVRTARSLDTAAVLDHCRGRLAKFKIPTTVVFTQDIPRTASGKIQKAALQERARRGL
jgi:fatty-acyl-CoA synthase